MTKKQTILASIICVIISCLFFFVKASFLSLIYFPFIAICFVLMGIIKLAFTSLKEEKIELIYNLTEGSIAIICGVIYFHFYTYFVVDIVCFVLIGMIPVTRLITAKNKINQIGFDFLKYIGLISILAGYSKVNKVFFIFCGIIWLIIAILIIIIYLKGWLKYAKKE